jgi:hypothetical protein
MQEIGLCIRRQNCETSSNPSILLTRYNRNREDVILTGTEVPKYIRTEAICRVPALARQAYVIVLSNQTREPYWVVWKCLRYFEPDQPT